MTDAPLPRAGDGEPARGGPAPEEEPCAGPPPVAADVRLDRVRDAIVHGRVDPRDADAERPPAVEVLVDGVVRATVEVGDADAWKTSTGTAPGPLPFAVALPAPEDTGRVYRVRARCGGPDGGAEAEGLPWCPAVDALRAPLRRLFVPGWYCTRHGLESLDDEAALKHYLGVGIYLDLDPNPWFDTAHVRREHGDDLGGHELPILGFLEREHELRIRPSRHFDPGHYARVHTDLETDRGFLEHFTVYGHREGRSTEDPVLPTRLSTELAELAALEPTLPGVGRLSPRVIHYPRLTTSSWEARRLRARLAEPVEVVVCVPFVGLGGPDLVGTLVLRALQEEYGIERVLLVITEDHHVDATHRIDPDTRVHCLDGSGAHDDVAGRAALLHEIVGTLDPARVVNVNSHACWQMYLRYGRQLASRTELIAWLFHLERAEDGSVGGYVRDYLPRTLPWLAGVACDNAAIARDLVELYGFAPVHAGRLHRVPTPVPIDRIRDRRPRGAGDPAPRSVLWVGRLVRRKRPDRLLALAERLPNVRFVVYALPGDSTASDPIVGAPPPNLEYRGTYASPEEIDPDEFGLMLNTSESDGLPVAMLQMAAAGLPLLTTVAGGIAELVDGTTGHAVDDPDEIEAWADAVQRLLLCPEEPERRARAARARVRERHRWEAFTDALGRAGVFGASGSAVPPPLVERRRPSRDA